MLLTECGMSITTLEVCQFIDEELSLVPGCCLQRAFGEAFGAAGQMAELFLVAK